MAHTNLASDSEVCSFWCEAVRGLPTHRRGLRFRWAPRLGGPGAPLAGRGLCRVDTARPQYENRRQQAAGADDRRPRCRTPGAPAQAPGPGRGARVPDRRREASPKARRRQRRAGSRGQGETQSSRAEAGGAPHDLRHSCAGLLFAAGVPVPKVAAILRHASPRITLTVYAGLVESQRAELRDDLEAALR